MAPCRTTIVTAAITMVVLCVSWFTFVDGGGISSILEDSIKCGGSNGLLCHGHGTCSGGVCTCNSGFTGPTCGTSASTASKASTPLPTALAPEKEKVIACSETDSEACSGNGICVDGTCTCSATFSGILCEMSASQGFCQVYQQCAECAAFGAACPPNCAIFGSFQLVLELPVDPSGSLFHRCRARSSVHQCNFLFQLKEVRQNEQMDILVKSCQDPDVAGDLTPATSTFAPENKGQAGDKSESIGDNTGNIGSRFEPSYILVLSVLAAYKRL